MFQITVIKRSDDYMAYFDNDSAIWECAKTSNEAIGKLIANWGDTWGLLVVTR